MQLAQEWDLEATASWIEGTDSETYGRMIIYGPDVVQDETSVEGQSQNSSDTELPDYLIDNVIPVPPSEEFMEQSRENMRDIIIELSKRATLTIADTYATEQMDVPIDRESRMLIASERTRLNQNLAEAAKLWSELEEIMAAVERGTGSLQRLIDPENY